jgi:hypothetical protein
MVLPSVTSEPADPEIGERLNGLLGAAHAVWASPSERRRMRAFGWRPAVEEGVLKREWHGLNVRVSARELLAERPGGATLCWRSDTGLTVDGGLGFAPAPATLDVVNGLLGLIGAYERWIEAREGRKERIGRAPAAANSDRRPVNALAETRRLQRMLQVSGPPSRAGR